jgi:cell division protein FtsB
MTEIPSLTVKGQQLAGQIGGALLVLVVVFFVGRCTKTSDVQTATDTAAEKVLRAQLAVLEKRADSLVKVSQQLAKAAAAAKAPHVAAIAKSDTGKVAADSAHAALDRVLQDSLAKIDEVKAAARALEVKDSIAFVDFLNERVAASGRITKLEAALVSDTATMDAQSAALAKAAEDRGKLDDVVKDLKHQQPSWMHRAFNGIVTVGVSAGCAAAGAALGGPLTAVGAGVVCAGVVSAILP